MHGLGPFRSPSRRLLVVAFGLLAVGVIGSTVFGVERTWDVERNASLLVEDALAGVRLLDRISLDVARERVLIDHHIIGDVGAVDEERQRILADREASVRAYEPLADGAEEARAWAQVRSELSEVEASAGQVLALSRQNRDAAARVVLAKLGPRFDAVQLHLEDLSAQNIQAASAGLVRIRQIRTQLVETDVGLGVLGLVGVILVGGWALREVERRDRKALRERQLLEQRNRDLDAFAGRVAHDIRGPLGIVSLAAARLGPGDGAAADMMRRGVARMTALVEDLLVLARVETLQGSCDPALVSAELEAELTPRVTAEKGTLRVSVEHATVRCSDGLLRQVLDNLVDNALKYRRPQVPPEIELSGRAEGGEYRLRVTDNGVGMSREDMDHVFEPFFRSQETRDRPGTGLGLSIVQRVASASGGAASVASRPGHGASFFINLPLRPMDPEARPGT